MKISFFLQFITIIFLMESCSSIVKINDNQELDRHELTGYWEDERGIVSHFQIDGTFKTISTDGSNTTLATGFYYYNSTQNIEINLTSLIRNTSEKIKCKLIKKNRMNCLSRTKGQFYLERTHLTEQPLPNNELQSNLPDDPSEPPISVIFYN